MYAITATFFVIVPPEDEESKDVDTICKEIETYFDNLLMSATEYEPSDLEVVASRFEES